MKRWKNTFGKIEKKNPLHTELITLKPQTVTHIFSNVAYRETIYRTGGCSGIPYQSNRFGDSKCVLISYYFATYVSEVKILLLFKRYVLQLDIINNM